jgi:hypothetical protein
MRASPVRGEGRFYTHRAGLANKDMDAARDNPGMATGINIRAKAEGVRGLLLLQFQ